MLQPELVIGVSLLYILALFLIAAWADRRQVARRSIVANPHIYSLSIAVYATSWTFYGSVGKAATTGLDFLLIYLGPSLTAFSWWFVLRKTIRICKDNNITSIADFISSRYGKSQRLGGLVTLIAMFGIMPYIALQLKAVSTSFEILCGQPHVSIPLPGGTAMPVSTSALAAGVLALFAGLFGAKRLSSTERHEGLVAAIALESVVKLCAFVAVGIFVTFFLFDGFPDIFARMAAAKPELLDHLTTFGGPGEVSYATIFSMLVISMGAIMLLPRQFHLMVIENADEKHIREAMWLFPAYLFLINLFVMPIALAGILTTGSSTGADFFVLSLPLKEGHQWLALLAFLGGFSAAAGMVMVESIAISTMLLDHLLMPILVRIAPNGWFPGLLLNLKRGGILLVVFLGFLYHNFVGEKYMLVNLGIISFVAAAQFAPAFFGGLYWRRGNKAGALVGMSLGFILWFYTLLLPSVIQSGWWENSLLEQGLFGISLLRPTALFGLDDFDLNTHAVFWSLLFNIGGYLAFSILMPKEERERESAEKFVAVFKPREEESWERKRLSKPVTIMQFVNLMAKFVGEEQANSAIAAYLGNREIDENGRVSEFELPSLKRFIEKTLASAVGAAAAGAIVESYLSEIGSRMESFYDVFQTVRASLEESRESLYVRLRASEIMNRTLDLQIIIDDLLDLIRTEFEFNLVVVRLATAGGLLKVRGFRGNDIRKITRTDWDAEGNTYIGEAFLSNRIQFVNDVNHATKQVSRDIMATAGVRSFAHIPIARQGESPIGILSVYSQDIVGLFTEQFLQLLSSLAGQLAQAITIVFEMEAGKRERQAKEQSQLEHKLVMKEMEIAQKIQLSLLPTVPPALPGMIIAGRCLPAAHVGGDYYDYFLRGDDTLDIVIADVSGHNVGAALIMAETRSVLRAHVQRTVHPGELMRLLNDVLYDDLTRSELFISMFYVSYSFKTRLLRYCNAGHNRPLLLKRKAPGCSDLDTEGLILGVLPEVDFEEKSVRLDPGDIVLLYTDGIIEAQNATGEFFGVDRLCRTLHHLREETPEAIVSALFENLDEFLGESVPQDDITLVALKLALP
jgi:sigma-B regulation protein RsbU (phosphoserine phosphatase)